MKNQINLFRFPKYIEILKYLYNNPNKNRVTDISLNNHIVYSYVSLSLKILKEIGLITNQFKGRENLIILTEKGLSIAKRINEITEMLK